MMGVPKKIGMIDGRSRIVAWISTVDGGTYWGRQGAQVSDLTHSNARLDIPHHCGVLSTPVSVHS